MKTARIALVCALGVLIALILSLTSAHIASAQDPCRDKDGNEICPYFQRFDGRINMDAMASIVGYCLSNSSIQVYSVDAGVGEYLYTVTPDQLYAGLAKARVSGNTLIAEKNARQLWALSSGELQLSALGYNYRFRGNLCGGFQIPAAGAAGAAATAVKTPVPAVRPVVLPTYVPTKLATDLPPADAVGTAITSAAVNLRVQPNFQSPVVAVLWKNATVFVLGRTANGQWLKINYQGLVGWIVAYYTTTDLVIVRLPVVQ